MTLTSGRTISFVKDSVTLITLQREEDSIHFEDIIQELRHTVIMLAAIIMTLGKPCIYKQVYSSNSKIDINKFQLHI